MIQSRFCLLLPLLTSLALAATFGPISLESTLMAEAPSAANGGPAADGTAPFGAIPASNDYWPPHDPAVLRKLQEWQDKKLGLMLCWQACAQWGIDSWPLCPERYDWNQRRDFVKGVLNPHAGDDRAYKASYENLITTFNPVAFDPDKWAIALKEAGMKYVLVMAKHCDGFCMYDTKTTDYRITSQRCPFHVSPRADTVKEISTALRKQGISVGIYFSKVDWNSPYYWSPDFPLRDRNENYDIAKHPEMWKKFKDFTWAQITELMTGYGPIDVLWLDGCWAGMPPKDLDIPGMSAMARKYQPGLIVVDRMGNKEYENYNTPEQGIPKSTLPYPWETCMTMGDHWNYFHNDGLKGTGTLIKNLCQIVARGGNYMIGTGPGPDGRFDPAVYARLNEVGQWLEINGEAIYGSRPVKPYEQGDCVFTRKPDGTIYAIVLAHDGNGHLAGKHCSSVGTAGQQHDGCLARVWTGFHACGEGRPDRGEHPCCRPGQANPAPMLGRSS